MIRRWLVGGRERAARAWVAAQRAGSDAGRARRRLRFWDALLDLRTLNGRI